MKQQLFKEKQYMATGVTPGFSNAPVLFEKGRGSILFDADGKNYVDFCSGTFTNSLGHSHPELVEFMQE